MNMSRNILIGAFAALAFTSTSALAGPGQALLRHADTNGDGKITIDEARADKEARFAKIDANADGFLVQEEITAAKQALKDKAAAAGKGGGRFAGRGGERTGMELDKNGDGKISKEEYMVFPMFDRFDANKDGVLEQSELPNRGK